MSPPRRLTRELSALDGAVVRIAGHLEDYRALGGVAFALVRDGSGTAQVTLKKGTTAPEMFTTLAELPRESVVAFDGTVKLSTKSQRGVELMPDALEVLARAEVPLPLGIVDKVNAELDTRLNHRVLDLRKPAVRAVFELRAALLASFREGFARRGFLEVETPKVLKQGAEGGATLFAVAYFEETAYLAQSPQLYKQMLISAGFERVFEIAPAFRAEPSDTVRHITEFTSLDAEVGYVDGSEELRTILEGLVVDALAGARTRLGPNGYPHPEHLAEPKLPFPRVPFRRCREMLGQAGNDTDLGTEDEKRLGDLIAKEFGADFYFITDFPTEAKAKTFYARRQEGDPSLTEYFDLGHRGLELASGGMREHRLDRLLANIAAAGLDPASFPGYLEAFRFGMPPHGGWGFGVDRLVQSVARLPNIRETRLFPRDRYRLEP
ncbi:MAG: aspartate--tRNA(Asn) ligase [Thermoplasmata archaeon]|nr:aspartate--tRNA(Asn) ligase [Thermoplasmata archaeon]